jgi:thiazole/oxazole-forming peptide maturase SagD family component
VALVAVVPVVKHLLALLHIVALVAVVPVVNHPLVLLHIVALVAVVPVVKNHDNLFVDESLQYIYENGMSAFSPQRILNFNDEPRLFRYTSDSLHPTTGEIIDVVGALDITYERALVRTIGEIIERFVQRDDSGRSDLPELRASELEGPSLLPSEVFPIGLPNLNELPFQWIESVEVSTGEKMLLPLPCVHLGACLSYQEINGYRSTNGCAFGVDEEMAIENALCELIERDALLIHHLSELTPPRVQVNSHKIEELLSTMERYRLDAHLFDFSLELLPPTYVCVLIDNTGVGPTISIGASCKLNPEKAVLKAILEAQQIRLNMRSKMLGVNMNARSGTINTRIEHWINADSTKDITYLLESNLTVSIPNKIWTLQEILSQFPHRLFITDLSPQWEKTWKVLKIVSPELVPLYFDDEYKPIINKRLGIRLRGREINKAPHP